MAKVKGSKQHKLVVRRHRPLAAYASYGLMTVAALLMAVAGFYLGRNYEADLYAAEPGERAQLQLLKQEISTLQRDHLVDQLALETSRKSIAELEEQLHQQGKVVSFYKSVMTPEPGAKGLQVQRFDATSMQNPRDYEVRWIMTQVGKNEKEIAGLSNLRLLGTSAGEPVALEMSEVSDQSKSLAFKFRYFQTLKLQVSLPDEFIAEKVEVVAQTNGKKPQSVTRQFDWIVQEALVDAR